MDIFVKRLYLFLCFKNKSGLSDSKNMKEMVRRMDAVLKHPKAFDFIDKCGRPGNLLYGEYMKEKTNRIKGKTGTSLSGVGI